MTTEAINNNLNILIDPAFVLAYQNVYDRQSYDEFYLPKIMVKDCNVIIDKLVFFDLPIKTKKKRRKRLLTLVEIMNIQQVIY